MFSQIRSLLHDRNANVRGRIVGIYVLLALFNVGAWVWAMLAFQSHPVLLGTAFLAYSFGLRHAVDADHIAAIDNVTRKLMQEGKRPVAVGLMFSLGHSTIVVIGSLLIALTTFGLEQRTHVLQHIGGVIGTSVSALFLLAVALINLVVLRSVYRAFCRVRRGEPYVEEDLDLLLANRGFLSRIFRPMFNLIRKSWHMYPLGVLFGLGFDTATEVGLLSISATEATRGLSVWSILVFPVLFAAGMSLIDTTDNVLMLGAYGWAYMKPIRKLYYNMTITGLSVLMAVVVGGIEVLGLLCDQFHLQGAFWGRVSAVNANLGVLGYGIIAVFVLGWVLSIAFYKVRGLDSTEEVPLSSISGD
jgi:nickel/cobalt transporter (NiCoT) family protein